MKHETHMPSRKDDDSYSESAMGFDPLGEDDEVLARTLYSSGNRPLHTPEPTPVPQRTEENPPTRTAAPTNEARREPPAPRTAVRPPKSRKKRREKRPQHYKVLSISLYNEDIEQMDELVKELKEQGFTRMNRSALIRFALDQVDISKMPRGY